MGLDVFTKRLRAYRKLKHLTQQEFALMMGVSVALVGGWERGTREPTNEQVKKIMTILQVTHEELGISDE